MSVKDQSTDGLSFTSASYLSSVKQFSVDINANGDIISVGGPGYDEGQASNAGHVRMYLWIGSTWDPIVQFPGEYYEDYAGTSVSLNSDGNCVAVGAEGHDNYYGDYDWNNGQARVICCLARR